MTGSLKDTDVPKLLFELANQRHKQCPFEPSLLRTIRLKMKLLLAKKFKDTPGMTRQDSMEEIFRNQKDPIQFELAGLFLAACQDPDWDFLFH